MSTTADMVQCECRNVAGYPMMGGDNRGNVYAPVDKSTNKPLPWIVLNAVIGSMALMGVIMMPVIIDAKVRANSATCELALKTAYTAKDQIDVAIAKAKARESK